jgi:DNA-binding LacI/PurR family transcriptional regulator
VAAAAAAAARHVTGLGHRRVAVVSLPLAPDGRAGPADLMRRRNAVYAVARARLAGVGAALAEAGIDPAATPVHECAAGVRAAGRAAAERLLAGPGRPTAVLATNDPLALGVLDAAAAAGLAVPGDLAVAGLDDVPAAAPAGLTSVAQDHRAKGRAAAEVLLGALRGEPVAPPRALGHRLVVRATTGPPG